MKIASRDVSIVPLEQVGELFRGSKGHGVLVDCGRYRLQVGAIIPQPDGKFWLDMGIFESMQLAQYSTGRFSEVYGTFEAAVEAAQEFLLSKRKAEF
ncbi:MAG: hypothetical protein ACREUB_12105 [Burkholderiales bacterium]